MCKHNWIRILPTSAEMPAEQRVDYLIDAFIHGGFRDCFYCDKCYKTGHSIKSHRGGIRVHYTDLILERANEVRRKYDLPILTISTPQ